MASGQQYGTSYSGGKCIKAEYELSLIHICVQKKLPVAASLCIVKEVVKAIC